MLYIFLFINSFNALLRYIQEKLEDTKGQIETVNQRGQEIQWSKWRRTKGQTMFHKTLNRNLTIAQHGAH